MKKKTEKNENEESKAFGESISQKDRIITDAYQSPPPLNLVANASNVTQQKKDGEENSLENGEADMGLNYALDIPIQSKIVQNKNENQEETKENEKSEASSDELLLASGSATPSDDGDGTANAGNNSGTGGNGAGTNTEKRR